MEGQMLDRLWVGGQGNWFVWVLQLGHRLDDLWE